MYILVLEDVPLGHALVAVAHGSLAAYLRFREHPEVAEWLSNSFKKVICRVTAEEFEDARTTADHVVITESSLEGREVALALRPRTEWPPSFHFYRLYRTAPGQ
jgi:peptidyl-tRNA hydrolase